jgi:hypothetical protein
MPTATRLTLPILGHSMARMETSTKLRIVFFALVWLTIATVLWLFDQTGTLTLGFAVFSAVVADWTEFDDRKKKEKERKRKQQ